MESQILKLNEPYEYIYCNGSIGLHIATMIVYEAKVNEDGDYELVTHSHPVVKYHNRPGGTVWNRAELADCHVLCREDNKRISMERFYNFVSDLRDLRDHESSDDMDLRATEVIGRHFSLKLNGIEIEWPMIRKENGDSRPQLDFDVAFDIRRNPKGSKFKYTCSDLGASDETIFLGGAPLFFYFEFNTKKELREILTTSIQMYYRMFRNHQFRIKLGWEEGSEFADVIQEVARHEPTIREQCNDDDV